MPNQNRKKGTRFEFDAKREVRNIITQIRNYFKDCAAPEARAVIGISGGKDSTIAAKLLVEALGPDRVVGVLMPDGEQSDFDVSMRVVNELGISATSLVVNIGELTDAAYATLERSYKPVNETGGKLRLTVKDNVTINTPPRMRMGMLYAVAASLDYDARVINTCNASEDYIGYSTKYGDSAGDYGILQEYTVSEIYEIGDALGISRDLVHKKPSDGLCGLCDEDRFGFSYEDLDEFIVTGAIADDASREKIIRMHNAALHKLVPMPKVNRLHYKY